MALRGLNFRITASDRSKTAFNGVQNNLRKTQGLQRSWNAGLNSNRRAVQQFGFQMSDFAIQIAGGQSAMLAFTQQGGQMLQFFGPAGAMAAAFLAVFGSLAIAFTRSGKALSDLTPILGVLRDDFAAIGRGLTVVKELMIDFGNVVLNNMDRILVTTATVAGLMAGRWVVAFVAARIATFTLVGALTALRVAIMRTGVGLLIVGLGEAVYQFTRLVKAVGGFSNAMVLMKDLAVEVLRRIGAAFGVIPELVNAAAKQMHSFFVTQLTDMAIRFARFTQDIASGLNELFGTNLNGVSVMSGWVAEMQDLDIDVAQSAYAAAAAVQSAWSGVTAPMQSVAAIREALDGLADSDRIDMRDWFGGGAAGGEGGGSGTAAAVKEQADEIESIFEQISGTIKSSLGTAFRSITDRTKSLKDIVGDMLSSILNKLNETLMNPVWDAVGAGISGFALGTKGENGTYSGGFLSGAMNKVTSFSGGGFTGSGLRAGGLDGKGGRMAMVHPNETVLDHTKGQGLGGGQMNIQVHVHENATDGETRVQQSDGRIDIFLRKALKDSIGGGGVDREMRERYGLRPQAMGG